MKCKKCEYFDENNFKFCPECGTKNILTTEEKINELFNRIENIEQQLNKKEKIFISKQKKNNSLKPYKNVSNDRLKLIENAIIYFEKHNISPSKALRKTLKKNYGGQDLKTFKSIIYEKYPNLITLLEKRSYLRKKKRKPHRKPIKGKQYENLIYEAIDLYKNKNIEKRQAIAKTLKRNSSGYDIRKFNELLNKKIKTDNKKVSRMKFIQNRIKSLVKQYNYSYEKAFKTASIEWKNKNIEKDTFPKMEILNENDNETLKNIVKNMINNNSELKKDEFDYCFEYNNWEDFLVNFVYFSDRVSKYLKIENKFSIQNNILCYG